MSVCGRSCESCGCTEAFGCKGCEETQGNPFWGCCQVTACCKEKNLSCCADCPEQETCELRQTCAQTAEKRLNAREEKRVRIREQAPILGKWLWVLFWITFPTMLGSLMSNQSVTALLPSLEIPGYVIAGICSVVSLVALWHLRTISEKYRKGVILEVVAAALSIILLIVQRSISGLVTSGVYIAILLSLSAVALVAYLMGTYFCYCGHAEALTDIQDKLAKSWWLLWKWYLGLTIGLFGGLGIIVVMLISNPFSAMYGSFNLILFLILAAALGMFVVAIIQMVKLYQTAKVFRTYSDDAPAEELPVNEDDHPIS